MCSPWGWASRDPGRSAQLRSRAVLRAVDRANGKRLRGPSEGDEPKDDCERRRQPRDKADDWNEGQHQGEKRYVGFRLATTVFLSLHSGQSLRVLSNPQRRGRDLGLFNLTNTVPSMIMPLLAVSIVPGEVWRSTVPA